MIRTRIAEVAHARGLTVRELARRLTLYPSNLSLTDAGKRRPSMRLLSRLAEALDCSPGELLTTAPPTQPPVFRRAALNAALHALEHIPDGTDRSWTHRVLLTWQRHYRHAHATPRPR